MGIWVVRPTYSVGDVGPRRATGSVLASPAALAAVSFAVEAEVPESELHPATSTTAATASQRFVRTFSPPASCCWLPLQPVRRYPRCSAGPGASARSEAVRSPS